MPEGKSENSNARKEKKYDRILASYGKATGLKTYTIIKKKQLFQNHLDFTS